ncbi:S ribonuclease [Pyrus ussuriensis x Pyrus communis]|uniref:S ribonuclease n=1 Tax=Pyrus ussuriensis x Pyrus communis TaxID=2448454 RepID=A0A5N5GKA6_9ROSA|nr:S ribonuclease [Pyrus ussuriensis x Pyrus communis]
MLSLCHVAQSGGLYFNFFLIQRHKLIKLIKKYVTLCSSWVEVTHDPITGNTGRDGTGRDGTERDGTGRDGTERDRTERNEAGAKMPSDGNKEEEEGDGEVIILCSTDVERVVPGG